mmetsp:Transcript_21720/g.61060  ORF Transcript_21720/g.61060 Transcript_21720/m.61060 type:complete len:86 (+) Transcript_21720:138-395(+)
MGITTPIFIGTAIYLLFGVGGSVVVQFVPQFDDKALARTLVWTAVICLWLMWIIVYMSQMYPVPGTGPELPESYECEVNPAIECT